MGNRNVEQWIQKIFGHSCSTLFRLLYRAMMKVY
jgi:hypothetical protein